MTEIYKIVLQTGEINNTELIGILKELTIEGDVTILEVSNKE